MKINPVKLDGLLDEIGEEYYEAKERFEPFHSLHEAYAIIKEEIDEFWEVVKLNQKKNPDRLQRAREEAKQIAAMCLGVLYEFPADEDATYGEVD